MSDSESQFGSEPNAFEGESSDSLFDSDNEAVGSDAEDGEDTDIEILGEGLSSVPTHGIRKGLMTQPMSLAVVYHDGSYVGRDQRYEFQTEDSRVPEDHTGHQSEASASGRGEPASEPSSRLRVSVVFPNNPRVPIGVPKENLFGVDYLEPNKITEREIESTALSTASQIR